MTKQGINGVLDNRIIYRSCSYMSASRGTTETTTIDMKRNKARQGQSVRRCRKGKQENDLTVTSILKSKKKNHTQRGNERSIND